MTQSPTSTFRIRRRNNIRVWTLLQTYTAWASGKISANRDTEKKVEGMEGDNIQWSVLLFLLL